VQPRAEDKVPLQERLGAFKNIEDFLLLRIHAFTLADVRQKTKTFLYDLLPVQ
jgi:hypothetical protein